MVSNDRSCLSFITGTVLLLLGTASAIKFIIDLFM